MNPDLMDNVKKLPTNYTTWVIAALMAVVGYWLQLPAAEQAALMQAYPWLKHAAPVAGLLAFVFARVLPQDRKPPADPPQDGQP